MPERIPPADLGTRQRRTTASRRHERIELDAASTRMPLLDRLSEAVAARPALFNSTVVAAIATACVGAFVAGVAYVVAAIVG